MFTFADGVGDVTPANIGRFPMITTVLAGSRVACVIMRSEPVGTVKEFAVFNINNILFRNIKITYI